MGANGSMTEINKTTDTTNEPNTQSNQSTVLDTGSQQRTILQVETKPMSEKQTQESQESVKLACSGNRPIGTTNLEYTQTISNRPIISTSPQVHHTMSASGIRPVVSSGLEVHNTISASGVRPIGTNHLKVNQTLMNRPVASSQVDSEGLMGFLD